MFLNVVFLKNHNTTSGGEKMHCTAHNFNVLNEAKKPFYTYLLRHTVGHAGFPVSFS